jgi:tetratricopeptide (TPR) repeat protein
VYAGAALAWLREQLLARRGGVAALAVGACAAIVALSHRTAGALEREQRERATEYVRAAKGLYQRGDLEGVMTEARSGLRAAYRGPEQRSLPRGYAQLAQTMAALQSRTGRTSEAVEELNALARDYPEDADIESLLGAVYRAAGDEQRAQMHADAATRLRAGSVASEQSRAERSTDTLEADRER